MSVMLQAAGLHTFYNNLSSIPEGALFKAANVIIDRNSVVEPRRGFKQYTTVSALSTDRAKQLFTYKGRLLAHYDDKLEYDSDNAGTMIDFTGDYMETQTGLRIKGIEANSNFFFTTSTGIKKISASSASAFTPDIIRDAGGPKALDVEGIINYSTTGFFTEESKVAYRVVWGYRDANLNLIIGSPSPRTVVTNISTTLSATVDLSFPIPTQISTTDTMFFYQIYRTAVKELGLAPSLDDIDPGDEMYLVIEDFPTSAELTTTRVINVNDSTPEDFRQNGALLYTNLQSGEGINQSNEPPPLAKDIALFNGSTFYADTQTKHKLDFAFLSVAGLISSTSTITITNGSTTNTYRFVGVAEETEFTFDTQANTNDAGYFLINAANDIRKYFVWFDKTGTTPEPSGVDTVGRLGIEVDISAAITAADVASAVAMALNALDDFDAVALGAVVTVTNTENGSTVDAVDGAAPVGGVFAINILTQGDGEDIVAKDVLLSAAPTPSQQIDITARSLIRVINQQSSEIVQSSYLSGPDDLPGQILLEAKDFTSGEFYILANSSTTGEQFNPVLPDDKAATIATGTGTVVVTSVGHGYVTGQQIVLYSSTTTPNINGVYTITVTGVDTFTISTTVTIAGSATIGLTTVDSDNEVVNNRLYFSKYQQPEAVPIVNFIDVGPQDKAILRILPLRDSLFIFKEDGIYRLSGPQVPNFSVALFDTSAALTAPDSAVSLNNQIYALTTQGVIRVSETGVGVISRPIEDKIIAITTNAFSFETVSFGVAYETDRAYLLWTPTSEDDTADATQCFRFNTFTQAWTIWEKSNRSGIVNSRNDKLYLGAGSNIIEEERKNRNRFDQADYEFDLQILANSIIGTDINLSSNINVEVGDAITQTQYVTISQFNRLLRKLDADIGLTDDDYYNTLNMSPGDDLSDKMILLVAKLNADPSTASVYVFSGTSDFATIQTEYNVMINTLNSDTGVFFSNYKLSTGTILQEATVIENIKNTNRIIISSVTPFLEGPILHLKGIITDIEWAPQHFGDPSALKQIPEATFLFEDNIFTQATVSYNSDLSSNFSSVDFSAQGNGDWGNFSWGEQNWGGEGNQIPMRTYIPLEKQRARFLRPKFEHSNALEKYSILGVSFTPRVVSTRGYR